MKKYKTIATVIALFFSTGSMLTSCKENNEEDMATIDTDKKLFDIAKDTTGFIWYRHSGTLLNKSIASGHSQPFMRTRYNALAASKLDSSGKVLPGIVFPEGSLVVKELYENSTSLALYAILYKNADSPDADAHGWVWGYVKPDGSVAEPASKKGVSCISCHGQEDNVDYTLMNKYFP